MEGVAPHSRRAVTECFLARSVPLSRHMVWGQKDSNEPVTVAYLLERQVALSWQEAVAIALETAEMAERSGRGTVPRDQNIELKSGGTLEFLRGRVETGAPVSSVAVMLNALLPKDRPTKLRLLVSTAGPGSETYKSLGEFVEALKYFERPGRRQVLAELHRRALETPIPVDAPGDKTAPRPAKKKPPMSAGRRWAVAAAVLLAIGAGAVAVAEKSEPGMVTGRTAAVQATAATWWASAMEATAWFREAASEDLAIVVERLEVAGGDLTEDLGIGDGDAATGEEEAEEADVEVTESTKGSAIESAPSDSSAAVAPAPEVKPESAATGDVAAPDPPVAALQNSNSTVASVEPIGRAPRHPAPSSPLFDSSDLHVTPPTIVRLQLPQLVDQGLPLDEQVGVVEAIVSTSGEVEKVQLLSPHRSVHQGMILSAVKTWRFQPALRDGDAVRYRHLIPVAIPRCQTHACP